jgi:hypothetical protein
MMRTKLIIALTACLAISGAAHLIIHRHLDEISQLFNEGRIGDDDYAPDELFSKWGEAALIAVLLVFLATYGWRQVSFARLKRP